MNAKDPHSQFRNRYKIDIKDFKIVKLIKKGGFGSVLAVRDNKGQIYAAKVVNFTGKEEDYKRMINREISIMMRISHPTLIKFYGYSLEDFQGENNVTILMELFENGSLYDQLTKSRKGQAHPEYDNNTVRQIILIGISRGMMFLHQHHILHRDLKPDNILLDADLRPHIIDFGLSKFYELQKTKNVTQGGGTRIYMSPESLLDLTFNEKTDVYSFGILMFEVVTGQIPYPEYEKGKMTDFQFQKEVIENNLRPKFKISVKPAIRKLIERCWSKKPDERPTFEEIYNKLAFSNDDWIIDVYEEKETNDEYEVNKYFLDFVDTNEIQNYIDDILEKSPIDELKEKFECFQREMMKKIENKDEINQLKKENKELKRMVSHLESIITIEGFNATPLKEQKNVLSSIINIKTSDYINNVLNLVSFLSSDKINDGNYLKIISNNPNNLLINNEDDCPIYFTYNLTEKLYYKKSFQSSKFSKLIKTFSKVYVELKYPDKSFDLMYKQIIDFKKSLEKDVLVRIAIYINDINAIGKKFYHDDNINYVKFDSTITTIKSQIPGIFQECSSLEEVEIPSSVTEIGDFSFAGCRSLFNVKLPSSIRKIGKCAFTGCQSLFSIKLPLTIDAIEDYTFASCSSLSDIIIPPNVKRIGNFAFAGCSSLKSIEIPLLVKDIGYYAFIDCESLVKISIPGINIIAFCTFKNCSSLRQITISPGVKSIGMQAFYKCTSLSEITIPSGVKSIGDRAFSECTSLSKITIPSGVESIGNRTFCECTSLSEITIPSSVNDVGRNAFDDCPLIDKSKIPMFRKPSYMYDDELSGKEIVNPVLSSTGVYYDIEELRQLITSNRNPICVVTGKPLIEVLTDFCPYPLPMKA